MGVLPETSTYVAISGSPPEGSVGSQGLSGATTKARSGIDLAADQHRGMFHRYCCGCSLWYVGITRHCWAVDAPIVVDW